MLEEYDKLEDEISKVASSDMEKAKKLSKQKKELLNQMTSDELKALLKRPYPPQYKEVIKKYL